MPKADCNQDTSDAERINERTKTLPRTPNCVYIAPGVFYLSARLALISAVVPWPCSLAQSSRGLSGWYRGHSQHISRNVVRIASRACCAIGTARSRHFAISVTAVAIHIPFAHTVTLRDY